MQDGDDGDEDEDGNDDDANPNRQSHHVEPSAKVKSGPYSTKSQGDQDQYLDRREGQPRCSNCIQGDFSTGPTLFSTKMKKAREPTRGSLG